MIKLFLYIKKSLLYYNCLIFTFNVFISVTLHFGTLLVDIRSYLKYMTPIHDLNHSLICLLSVYFQVPITVIFETFNSSLIGINL